jgi:ABC-type sugar transport system permease subunit
LQFLLALLVVLVHVVVEVALGHERGLAFAQLADIRPNTRVRADMRFQVPFLLEAFATALKWTLIGLSGFLVQK